MPQVFTYPFDVPSGTVIFPTVSGSASLGTAALPFSGIYATSFYGAQYIPYVSVSGNYSAAVADVYIDVNTSSGARTITVPSTAAVGRGKLYYIRKSTVDGNQVIVSGTSGQTFNDSVTKEILYQYSTMGIISNGTNWNIF